MTRPLQEFLDFTAATADIVFFLFSDTLVPASVFMLSFDELYLVYS